MSDKMNISSWVTIIVSIIGLVGVITTAYLGYLQVKKGHELEKYKFDKNAAQQSQIQSGKIAPVSPSTAVSNKNDIFMESFIDNHNNWNIINDEHVRMVVEDNKLTITNNKDNTQYGYTRVDIPFFIDTSKEDLLYEVTFRKLVDGGFPFLILFGEGVTDTYGFGVIGNKYIYGRASTKAWEESIIPYTTTELIENTGRLNKIAIRIEGSVLELYINDNLVEETRSQYHFGNRLGLLSTQEKLI